MITLSPIDLLLRVSAASVGAGESPPNTNHGPYVKRVLARTGNAEGDPWCASQVTDWGVLSLLTAWPVPRTASVMVIADWAQAQGCRYVPKGSGPGQPQVGDLYLLWSASLKRWGHMGLIIAATAGSVTVTARDGNTSDPTDTDPATQREGWLVAEKSRTLTGKDRLVRWVDALV